MERSGSFLGTIRELLRANFSHHVVTYGCVWSHMVCGSLAMSDRSPLWPCVAFGIRGCGGPLLPSWASCNHVWSAQSPVAFRGLVLPRGATCGLWGALWSPVAWSGLLRAYSFPLFAQVSHEWSHVVTYVFMLSYLLMALWSCVVSSCVWGPVALCGSLDPPVPARRLVVSAAPVPHNFP